MKTVVLDDDPTGTQCARDVTVLLEWTVPDIVAALRSDDAVYLQTNSRAIDEAAAIRLAIRLRIEIDDAQQQLGEPVQVVLRGDSTLRGHVFAESDIFVRGRWPILFVPAFPSAGRVTIGSEHFVDVGGARIPVADSEYANDPVFGYEESNLLLFAWHRGGRKARSVPLSELRATGGAAVVTAIESAAPGEFVVPDIETDADLRLVASAVRSLEGTDTGVVVRSAAPLAAMIAGCFSNSYLQHGWKNPEARLLVVCGSHTSGATRQLESLEKRYGWQPNLADTDLAFEDSAAATQSLVERATNQLSQQTVAVIASERQRRAAHRSLDDGRVVMSVLVAATLALSADIDAVITKGGITAAEVVHRGLGAASARVLGQLLVGVSVWRVLVAGTPKLVTIVPGNVGNPATLADLVAMLRGESDRKDC